MAKKHSLVFWGGMGCLALILCCGGGIAALVVGGFTALKHSGPYRDAVTRVRASPEAVAALGEPIEPGLMVAGSINEELGGGGSVRLAIPVHGPKGSGTLQVEGSRAAKVWSYSTLDLKLDGSGKKIDLRPPGAQPAAPGQVHQL